MALHCTLHPHKGSFRHGNPRALAVSLQTVALISAGVAGGALAYYQQADVETKFELASATGPLVRLLDPETAHRAGILAARLGLFPTETRPDPDSLHISLWGLKFSNPIGEGGAPASQLLGGASQSKFKETIYLLKQMDLSLLLCNG
jgi:hypothetical protein